uniref:Regulator of G protein signaling 2 n=1 Tax=Echeneis naucrates TaxID=173247 RepID=A0A665TCY8_ECHNA
MKQANWANLLRHSFPRNYVLCNKATVPFVTGGQMVFREFLKSECCEENLDFWLACQERAARINEEFIEAESPRQVNLDFYTREIISRNLQKPSPLCFALAQKKVYSLMVNGSFPRFIESEQYNVLCGAASEQRGLWKQWKARHNPDTFFALKMSFQ